LRRCGTFSSVTVLMLSTSTESFHAFVFDPCIDTRR
jgi:hypothetical protein